jgi:phage minor structural protein
MIQVYSAQNTKFEKNGDVTLFPTSAKIHPILNGVWEGTLTHPIDEEGRWKYITEEAVIKMPSFNGEQLFRIKEKEKTDSGITAMLEPIFMDAMDDCFLVDVRPTNKTGSEALAIMTASNSKYTGESDIIEKSTAYYQFKNLIEAINGEDGNSFINRWGGEILFDNYKVIINKRVGSDYGVELRYGKNIPEDGISEMVDIRDVVTRIYPKAYNGYTMTDNGYMDSEIINSYPTVKTATITFENVKMRADAQEGDSENGITICDTQEQLDAALKKECQEQFEQGIDKPKVTITANMVLLQDTDLYKDYQVLEKVSLGDTIHCKNNHLGIITDARVIELEYDSILKKVVSVVLGDFSYNYFNNVSSAVNRIDKAIRSDGSIVAEEIKGIINAINASLQLQSTVAKKVSGRAFLIEDLDPESVLFGAMEAGTLGLRISKKRNPDNRSWAWTTAITALGIIADAIVTGSITSRNWKQDTAGFRLDLDNGTINSKHLKLDANGLFTIYKALIDGGEITITDKTGNRIFRVSETEGFIFGEGENGAMRYDMADRMLKMYKDTILYGSITNYSKSNKKSISIGNNQIDLYSWQNNGDYIGSIGALAVKSDPDGRQTLGIYSDTTDRIGLGYVSGKGSEGDRLVTFLLTLDPTKLGNSSYAGRAIKFKEIPEIPGTLTLPDIYIGTTKISVFNGLFTGIKYGRTFDGKFKTGAGETVNVFNGAIESVT